MRRVAVFPWTYGVIVTCCSNIKYFILTTHNKQLWWWWWWWANWCLMKTALQAK